jgi:lipopolysaccharide transport system permease protein
MLATPKARPMATAGKAGDPSARAPHRSAPHSRAPHSRASHRCASHRASHRAWADLLATARLWRLCRALAWHDLRLRYHGSLLGPFWLTLSSGLTVFALGGLYATLLGQPAGNYVPYLAVSLLLWNVLAGYLAEACTLFTQQAASIRSLPMPYGVYAARLLLRSLFSLGHMLLVLPPVFILYGLHPGAGLLLLVPALLLWGVAGFSVSLALGAACARFRDVQPALIAVLQLGFFLTPVLWRADQLGPQAAWLWLNPFHPMLEVARAPLLGQPPAAGEWAAALVVTAITAALGWAVFARCRHRLPVWV